MSRSYVYCLSRLLCGGLLLLLSGPLNALEPPTPEQLRQYKADGTLGERAARARKLGNHLVAPGLAARARARLRLEAAKAAGLPTDGSEFTPPPAWAGGLPGTGTAKAFVLLVDFPDYLHGAGDTVADVTSKFFGAGDASQYPFESLHNYYDRSSYGKLNLQGNVLGWYTAAHNRSYYETAGNEALIMEALNYFNTTGTGHDFTQYDNDGDGKIDAFYIKWTGPDNGWANFWWAYQTGWSAGSNYRIDGKKLGTYVWSWIWNRNYDGQTIYQPHVDIHETGHLLGLPDLYDYDGSVGPKGGVGGLDMMDANKGDHNCFSKFLLGWLTPTFITSGTQSITLHPSGTSQDCVVIMAPYDYTAGTIYDEFFMVQYRKRGTGDDPSTTVGGYAPFPNDGYMIWHVDSSGSPSGFAYNNSYTAHKYLRLMEADGHEDIEAGRGGDAGDFYLPPKSFTDTTFPNSRDYAGQYTGVSVENLSSAGATMSATFSDFQTFRVEPASYNITYEGCQLPNYAVDPGETVTINFTLVNTGTVPTTNVIGTLQPTGGVTLPGAAGVFGASLPGGSLSRPFTFTAEGNCGGTITATLALQDGSTTLPSVSFTIPLGAPNGSGGYTCCRPAEGIGDFDGDADVDQEDFGRFQACLTAPNVQASPECQPGRLDNDVDVDQDDLVRFERCRTQPGTPADPNCRNQ